MLAIANHASGLVPIFEYSKQLFERIEDSVATADSVLIALGFFQVLSTFISGFLINRYGRRPMMLLGQAIIVLSLLFCGVVTMAVEKHEVVITLAIFFYTLGYSISLGPLFMMYAI
jgi:MFS family permease